MNRKLIFILIILIFIINSIHSEQIDINNNNNNKNNNNNNNYNNNNNNNNNLINIYLSSRFGNDLGNGTILSPFQTFCKIESVLNSQNDITAKIIINIGYGSYNENDCKYLLLEDFNYIIMKPYNDSIINKTNENGDDNDDNISSNSNSSSNEIEDGKVIIYSFFNVTNSKLVLEGPLVTLYTFGFIFNESIFEISNGVEINVGYQENIYHDISSSNFIMRNSTISYGIIVFNDCKFEVLDKSRLMNISFSFNPNELSKPFKGMNVLNSYSEGTVFQMGSYDLNVSNSNLQDCIVDSYGFTNITESVIGQTLTNTWLSTLFNIYNAMFNILRSSISFGGEGARLYISQSKLISIPTINPISILETYADSQVTIENTLISGYRQTSPILLADNGGGQCIVKIRNVHVENCISSSLIMVAESNVEMVNVTFKNNILDSMVEATDICSIVLSDIKVGCNENNQFISTITMPIDPDSPYSKPFSSQSHISLSNMYLECVGPFDFQNSSILFVNVTMASLFESAYVSLYSNSSLAVIASSFLTNSYNGRELFNLGEKCILYIIMCNFHQSSSSIVYAGFESSTFIDNSNFINIKSETYPLFDVSNSTLSISNSYFKNIQSSYSSTINGLNSTIYITETTMDGVGISLMTSSECVIKIIGLTMSNCFTMVSLFESYADIMVIQDSRLIGNHGSGHMMIIVTDGTLNIYNVNFTGNSFSPTIQSYTSNVTQSNIIYSNNSGSFFSGYDGSLKINGFQYINISVPCDFLFDLFNTKIVVFSSVTFENNYFTQYLLMANNIDYLEFTDLKFIGNVVVSVLFPSPFFEEEYLSALFQIINCSDITLNGLQIENNSIATPLLSGYNTKSLVLNSSTIASNTITFSSNYLFIFKSSNLVVQSSSFQNNNADNSVLIDSIMCNTTIIDCVFIGNQNSNGNGSALNYNSSSSDNSSALNNYFQIINTFSNSNLGSNGGVFSFTGYFNFDDAFVNPLSSFYNNTFINNHANQKGGAIYTDYFTFSKNISKILNSNTFENNTSLLGPNFSSEVNNKTIQVLNNNVSAGISTTIYYRLIDFYNNTFIIDSGELNITILQNSNGQQKTIENSVIAGKGSFLYSFIGAIGDTYTIIFNEPFNFYQIVYIDDCLPYQIYSNSSETCTYCQSNYAFSQSYGECYPCDVQIMTCLTSTVFAIDGYYIVNNDVSMVEECPLDMCLSYNLCTSNSSFGDLCFSCLDEFGNTVQTKNGIRCCSQFKPILLIPILAFHLLFGLLLSLIKHNSFKIPIGQIIIFLQINSVVFFSYSGIYILPLFRMSVDMIDSYCLWEGLNYNFKSFLSFSIIISLFLIGSTDITPNTIIRIYKIMSSKSQKHHRNPSFLVNDFSNNESNTPTLQAPIAKYPNYIVKILEGKIKHRSVYYWRSIWSLFQLFVIPLIFNVMSSVISKQVNGENYLAVDFSIDYNQSNSNQACILIAVIIFVILSITLFMQVLLLITFKYDNSLFKNGITEYLYKIQQTLNYKKDFKWWDTMIIVRSIMFSVLSITMLFKMQFYIAAIISIQIFYATVYLLVSPIKKVASRDPNNYINLLQLIMFIIANSNLMQSKPLFDQGLTLTCLSFSFALILIILLVIKNKK